VDIVREPAFRICTEKTEHFVLTEVIPETLQLAGSCAVTLLPQYRHHFTKGTHLPVILSDCANKRGDNLVEKFFIGQTVHNKFFKNLFGYEWEIMMVCDAVGVDAGFVE